MTIYAIVCPFQREATLLFSFFASHLSWPNLEFAYIKAGSFLLERTPFSKAVLSMEANKRIQKLTFFEHMGGTHSPESVTQLNLIYCIEIAQTS